MEREREIWRDEVPRMSRLPEDLIISKHHTVTVSIIFIHRKLLIEIEIDKKKTPVEMKSKERKTDKKKIGNNKMEANIKTVAHY